MKSALHAWKSQMCRVVRLRHTRSLLSFSSYNYKLVVLSPVWQPHAAESCFEQCGYKSGWCNYCGGRNVGACCKKGAAQMNPPQDPSECRQFDIPTSYHRGKHYHACMHTDCAQSNTYYRGGKRLTQLTNVSSWEECQEHCKLFVENSTEKHGHVVFTMKPQSENYLCKCRVGGYRTHWEGAMSGPVECPEKKFKEATQTEEAKEETPHIPMKELDPCSESPGVKDVGELQAHHIEWLKTCYKNVTKVVTSE